VVTPIAAGSLLAAFALTRQLWGRGSWEILAGEGVVIDDWLGGFGRKMGGGNKASHRADTPSPQDNPAATAGAQTEQTCSSTPERLRHSLQSIPLATSSSSISTPLPCTRSLHDLQSQSGSVNTAGRGKQASWPGGTDTFVNKTTILAFIQTTSHHQQSHPRSLHRQSWPIARVLATLLRMSRGFWVT